MLNDYSMLRALVNSSGGTLPETEVDAGVTFRNYTSLDADGDGLHESYTMSLRVTKVSTEHRGWCVVITPEGIERCDPRERSSS